LLLALDMHGIFPIVLELTDCYLISCYLCKIH